MNITKALKDYEAGRQSEISMRITALFAIAAIILVMVLVAYCKMAANASPYTPRQAPGPRHGGNPHGGNPHSQPDADPDLPANQAGRDPYDGDEHNNKNSPYKPY